MNDIVKLIDDYSKNLKEIGKSNCEDTIKLEQGIALSKKTLNQMRRFVREHRFKSHNAEIKFFKVDKPYIHSRLIYFICRAQFCADKPQSNISEQRKFIKRLLKKIKRKKVNTPNFTDTTKTTTAV
jgi:RteC protein